jgi:hypothetical protein
MPDAGGFTDLTTRSAAPHATAFYLLYDDTNLYVGFDVEQKGTPILEGQTTNDVGFGIDDFVGIGLDTSGDESQVYFFEVTPRGVRYQQASENVRYRPLWQAASKVNAGRWTAVMVIPLHDLRLGGGATKTWRFNAIRAVASVGEHYSWAYDGIMQDGQAGNGWPTPLDARFWPALTGLHIVGNAPASRPRPRAEIYGLGSVGHDRDLFEQSDGSFRSQNVRPAGIDVSVPLTATISFVGTLAPDFSNVEVDQQTIAPQEFRRALQEYRPFFSQGANFINSNGAPPGGVFSAPNMLFYSPAIGPFDRGEKIEGSFGDQSFGVLNFRGYDQVSGNEFDDIVYGYKHALPNRTFLYWSDGVFAHHSLAGDDSTVEAGVAGRNLKTGLVYAIDQAVESGSWVPQGSARSSNGFIDVHKPNYEINLGYLDITPNYDPIDGFTSTSDVRGIDGFVNVVGAARGVKSASVFYGADRFVDGSGAVHQADSGIFINATFKNGFSIDGGGPDVGMLRSYAIPGGPNCSGPIVGRSSYTGFPCYLDGVTSPYNLMTVPIGYRDGTPSPIDLTAAWGNFGSDYLHLYSLTNSRPIGRILTLGLEYDGTYERAKLTGGLDSQWLRRVSLGWNLGPDSNLTLSLRSINGNGGFAPQPGTNVSAAFHRRFPNGNELFANFGTPAANTTLDRFIVKYVFHIGADAGT